MDHPDHLRLIRAGVPQPGGTWADLGSGTGAFTLALADLLGSSGVIYSVDRDGRALREQEQTMRAHFPDVPTLYWQADFTQALDLPLLDGVLMANSLHFHRHKAPILERVAGWLKPGGRLLVVEYNADRGNPWVPHPFSFPTWQHLAAAAGLVATRQVGSKPDGFMGGMYAAESLKQTGNE